MEGLKELDFPIRVLVLITKLDRGGAETMIMNYMRNMDRKKVQYDFLVNRQEKGAYEDEIQSLGGKIYRMCPMYPQYFARYKKEFREFLKEHPEYQIIHSNLEERSYFPLRIAAEMSVPVRIAHAHSVYKGINTKTVFRNYFRHHLNPYVTHRFACSQEAGEWLFGKNFYGETAKIIPNAIDVSKFAFSEKIREQYRAQLHLEGKNIYGCVARFSKQKNHIFLLDVFQHIHMRDKNAILLLVGSGGLEKKIRYQVKKLHLQDVVMFTGSVSNVYDYLQAMDAFIFPSLCEGLGMVLIEAQAAGLPCFASLEGIPKAAKVTNRLKFLSLNDSAKDWANQIMQEHLNQDRASYAQQVAKAGFDIPTRAKCMEDFYIDAYMEALQ